ncbi:response regulator transcription factor [Exiguobacterium flavidum]|uniref:response regulator transcription factor n=1 Tax=Exiguobacterium flavidum TaxID=2184695 RepID=UPI000DF82689|nr:response regulator transcription factor [Exiguobacterium flavidum]
MHTIYLVDDEVNLNRVLVKYLEQEGWNVRSFTDGESAAKAISEQPDLWVLDIMLPDMDGFQLIKRIKAHNEATPVIFISARDEDIDKIIGLEMGSDDYIAKPFLPRELVIRVRKILARTYAAPKKEAIRYGDYVIYPEKRVIEEDGVEIDMTSKEYDLLLLFATQIGTPMSREQILVSVWGDDYFGSDRVVDDLVRRVRKKLPKLELETIYGIGYRLVAA